MRIQILALTLLLGHLSVQALEAAPKSDSEISAASTLPRVEVESTKDKRQVSSKETSLYPNHRSESAQVGGDDPEVGQETIYGPKPNQFIIRPIAPHQHQQHESHQEPQLRNFAAANSRPHAAQLLEHSQELQHYVYLQDIQRHQPKAQVKTAATSAPLKKSTPVAEQEQETEQEAEQRYTVAIQQPQPGLRGNPYAQVPYQLPLPLAAPQHQHRPQQQQQQHQHQHQQQQQQHAQQPYQIIPEEQFLKLLEEELQARAYHEQFRQQQQHQHQQQSQTPAPLPPKSLPIHSTAATHKVLQQAEPSLGLGNYRERYVTQQQLVPNTYSSRSGPKYLPHQQQHQQQQPEEDESQPLPPQRPHHHQQQQLIQSLPPQIAYYQPQISYKALPNHPLAKSSLESEIEKLLAANKPGSVGHPGLAYVDSNNEPTLVNHQHQHQHVTRLPPPPPQHPPAPSSHPALRQPKAYLASTPNSLLDANNQPFIPSLFKFSNFQQPTPNYPQPQQQQHETKRLGPVAYPTSAPAQPQPSQYYYQETPPTAAPKPKQYRSKPYKPPTPSPTKSYEKAHLYADYERSQPPAPAPTSAHFYPSPRDPIKHASQRNVVPTVQPIDYPAHPAPSQSSIYVSQGTGIATPSRVTPTTKLRTLDEVKQLNLPPPNGKPLTQAEFQALVEAGYPVKAVPVPVPVPYEQYVKDHPEYRNHPPVDYAHLMRLATRQLGAHQQQYQHQHPHQHPHQHQLHSLASPSEPSVKILSTPTAAEAQQTATGIGGGSVTYLQRRPRDEQDTAVAGSETKATAPEPAKASPSSSASSA
ncbi:protein split ends [Drosophila grimshawi]|uniref:GH16048 n=1 Tax=Drosophila grimshawi TaxID=7222 RepID=B4J2T2_DROGR|nr:protein split ends [Drosophila grimshawi]EDV96073.1 GH16048 [Drosophila grimshawi]